MSFSPHGQSVARGEGSTFRNFCFLTCRRCGLPVTVEITTGTGHQLGEIWALPGSMEQLGLSIVQSWPPIPEPSAPANLPSSVLRAYLAAETTFQMEGQEEATAGSYGRALDVGTKLFAPELANLSLYQRIERLAEAHRITADLRDWAHEIRLIRNDALHDPDGVTHDELIAIRGFAETVLTYLFTLPAMLAARRAEVPSSLTM